MKASSAFLRSDEYVLTRVAPFELLKAPTRQTELCRVQTVFVTTMTTATSHSN